jgi:hypothetical protein
MRLDELEVKDPQLDEFVGKAVGAVGRGVGKVIGGVAKGVGAVAGVGQGIKKAFQKGKQASIDVIGGTGQGADAQAKPAASGSTSVSNTTSSAPAAASSTGSATSTNAAPETPTSQPAASSATTAPTAQPAATAGATAQNAPQNTDAVSKLKDRIFNLDTDSQRDILQLLQAQSKKPDASAKTTTKPQATAQDQTAKPAANTQPQATSQDQTDTDKSLSPDKFGSMVQNLAQPNAEKTTQTANTGTSTAQPDAQTTSDRPQGGGKVAGQLSTNPRAVKRREQTAAEKQKSIDADRETLVQTQSDSIQRSTTNMVSESQYQTFSLFRK